MPLSEHVYCVAVAFKMTERVEQWICINFCIKLEQSCTETILMVQKSTAMGNWWLAVSSGHCALSCIMSRAEFFGKTSNYPGDPAPLQPRFDALWLLDFPKTEIAFEKEQISDHHWDSGKYNREFRVTGRTVWGPKVSTLKGTGASLSYIQCFLYLVSSSINVSIFHIMWLDSFCTDIYMLYLEFLLIWCIYWCIYSSMRKKEILLFATMWINLEDIILSEISQRDKKWCMTSHICEIIEYLNL